MHPAPSDPLLWLGLGGRETWHTTDYFFDCNLRRDQPHYCLQLTLGGCAFYENAEGRSLLTPGTAFLDLIPGPFRYGYAHRESRGRPYELVYLAFLGPVAFDCCRHINRTFGHVFSLPANTPVQAEMLALAQEHRAGVPIDPYTRAARLFSLLMSLLTELQRRRNPTPERVSLAAALIAQHAVDPEFTVQSLADQLSCSREHLSRQYLAATGISLSDALNHRRLQLAAEALRSTTDKLDTIASRSGFSCANYLCRAFRKHFGISPGEYRLQPWLVQPHKST